MAPDDEMKEGLSLAGTIALPDPFPACGALYFRGVPADADDLSKVDLEIAHIINFKLLITRRVSAALVKAILAPADEWTATEKERARQAFVKPPTPTLHPHQEEWSLKCQADFKEALKHLAGGAKGKGVARVLWLSHAIIFVPETAPVLTTIQATHTAAESAEYYPRALTFRTMGCTERPYGCTC